MPQILDQNLYQRAKRIVYAQYKTPSAWRSAALVKKYKQLGGRYAEDGQPKNLQRWLQENWKDIGGQDYPVYRPHIRVNKHTPLTASEIDPTHAQKQIKLKQKIKAKSNLPPFIARK